MDIASMLNQTAVYWGAPAQSGWGVMSYGTPVEVSVRWMEKQEKFIDMSGTEAVSKSVVISETDFVLGGRLWLGSLSSLTAAQKADPTVITNCLVIRGYNKTPSLDATEFLRRAFL